MLHSGENLFLINFAELSCKILVVSLMTTLVGLRLVEARTAISAPAKSHRTAAASASYTISLMTFETFLIIF